MNARSKDEIRDIILNDLLMIYNRRVELSAQLSKNFEENVSYVRDLAAQLSQPSSGPLVPKTPRMLRKKAVQRIETIPEDEVFNQENVSPTSSLQSVNEEERKESEVAGRRTKRAASKRGTNNVKKPNLSSPSDSAKEVSNDGLLCYAYDTSIANCRVLYNFINIIGEEEEPD